MAELRFRWWALFLAAVLLLGAGWYFWGRIEEKTEEIKDLDVDLSLQGIELVKAGKGGKKWQLKAEKAKYEKGKEIIDLFSPQIIFYFEDSNNTVRVRASKGEVNQKQNRARLGPEVRAEYANSTVLTEHLDYYGQEKLARLKGGVEIQGRKASARSRQGTIDLEEERLNLQGNVEVVFHEGFKTKASSKP